MSDYDTEFRSIDDDAWYSVRLSLEGDNLRIQYLQFEANHDSVFAASSFKSAQEINDFSARFRPLSEQLQDTQCVAMKKGTLVCASASVRGDDNRFFDAIVETVERVKHCVVEGEEKCQCSFFLCWQHGPLEGSLMERKVENICIVVTDKKITPNAVSFVKMVREKLTTASDKPDPAKRKKGGPTYAQFVANRIMAKKSVVKLQSPSLSFKVNQQSSESEEVEDTDLGGSANEHTILLVDNLEKDLPSLRMMEWIYQNTNISSQVYVFPSLLSEIYTRGAILLNSKDLEKLKHFLANPNHIITSSKGRPLVVSSIVPYDDILFPVTTNQLRRGKNNLVNELMVVGRESKEYNNALKMLNLFKDFASHQKLFHNSLAEKERILLG